MNKTGKHSFMMYSSKEISSYVDSLGEVEAGEEFYLLVLSGPYRAAKKSFEERVEKKVGSFTEVNLRTLIFNDEQKSFKRIDSFFDQLSDSDHRLLLRNGDVLAGEYTGHTYSTVRYATPQEKYLLSKLKKSNRFIVIDIIEYENIDKTLERHSKNVIRFDKPHSFMGNLLWKLKQISLNGHTFANKRRPLAEE